MVDWTGAHRPAALVTAGVLLLLAAAPGTARGAAAGAPQLGRLVLVRGTVWRTEATCDATTTAVRRGQALVTSRGDVRISVHVRRDTTLSLFCTKQGPTVAPISCLEALTTPRLDGVGFTIATSSPPEISSYDFCIAGPGLAQCRTVPLGAPTPLPGHNPLRGAVFVCLPAS